MRQEAREKRRAAVKLPPSLGPPRPGLHAVAVLLQHSVGEDLGWQPAYQNPETSEVQTAASLTHTLTQIHT